MHFSIHLLLVFLFPFVILCNVYGAIQLYYVSSICEKKNSMYVPDLYGASVKHASYYTPVIVRVMNVMSIVCVMKVCTSLIGASLSEPHTSESTV